MYYQFQKFYIQIEETLVQTMWNPNFRFRQTPGVSG